jgi:hypothetical protein
LRRLGTSGSFADRLASAGHATATWLNPAAFTTAAAATFGTAPRTITDVRTPPQRNVDVSVAKNVRFTSGTTAQVKLEVFNVLNRVATNGVATTVGNATFGQITSPSGFMRLTQVMFRCAF